MSHGTSQLSHVLRFSLLLTLSHHTPQAILLGLEGRDSIANYMDS